MPSVTELQTPPTPPPDSGIVIFSAAAWNYIKGFGWWTTQSIQALYAVSAQLLAQGDATQQLLRGLSKDVKGIAGKAEEILDDTDQSVQIIQTEVSGLSKAFEGLASRAASQADVDALAAQVELLSTFVMRPVRGRVRISIKSEDSMANVHPTDTLEAVVDWENAAGRVVPEPAGDTTSWAAVDSNTAEAFAGANLASGSDDLHETVTFTGDDLTGTFVIRATLSGLNLTATSEQINVSPDNTPTQGVVRISLGGGA